MAVAPLYLKQRHIELLLALDDHRHLGRAAEQLHMSQPAASKSLAQLERHVGQALFRRTGTGTAPTALGEQIIAHARNEYGSAHRLASSLDALITRQRYLLRIGLLPSTSVHIVPALIARLLSAEPRLEISIHEGLLHDLIDRLTRGELDCVIGRSTSLADPTLIREHFLYHDPVHIVCGTHHPLAAQPRIELRDLQGADWILPSEGTVLSARLEEMFRQLDLRPPARYIRSNAIFTNVAMLNQQPWLSALPGRFALDLQQRGQLHILPVDTRINFGDVEAIVRNEETPSEQLRLALETLRSMFAAEP